MYIIFFVTLELFLKFIRIFVGYVKQIAKGVRPLILGFILCASHSRTFSILNGYSAPLKIYQHLQYHHDEVGPGNHKSNRAS
jgi:hypothetical protein